MPVRRLRLLTVALCAGYFLVLLDVTVTPAIVGATVASLPDRSGLASGLSNTARQLGGALGVALFATLAGPATASGFSDRVRLVLVGCAVWSASLAVLCIVTGRSLLHNRAHDDSSRVRDLDRAR